MTSEERKLRRLIDFEECWGGGHLILCDQIVQMLLVFDDLHEAIAVLELAKAKLSLLATNEGAVLRHREAQFFNPVVDFVPQHTDSEKEAA